VDFAWTEEQLRLRAEAQTFAQKALAEGTDVDDRDGRFPNAKWDELGSWGFFGLSVPERLGGRGLDPMTALFVTEGLCEACPDTGLMFSAVVQGGVIVPTLLRFATEEQRRRYLPGLIDGSTVGALAVTEPDSGSDAFAMKSSADPVEGGWRLHGSKTYITNAPIADLIIYFARTGSGGSLGGVSAFLVEADADGVDTRQTIETVGLRTAPLGEVILDHVFVPDRHMLGKVGFGLAVFNEAMEWERSFVMAVYVGMLERQLRDACVYSRERHAFGSPLSRLQLVADKLVQMRVRLETARLLLYRACWVKAQGKPALGETAMAKFWIGECAVASSLDAVQIRGASGYRSGTDAERDLRNAVGARIHSGTSDLQKIMIGRSMNL
jgi:alkylation response protein AidB-like acyl-CoA dehydrogenase